MEDAAKLPSIERSSNALFRQWPGLEEIADDDPHSADEHLERIALGNSLVAEDAKHGIVGFLIFENFPDALHIWEIAVEQSRQRQGIGKQLIEAAVEIAERNRAAAITLTTFREVPWNAPLYEKLGFQLLGEAELTPRLLQTLKKEKQAGLPIEQRCAMRMGL